MKVLVHLGTWDRLSTKVQPIQPVTFMPSVISLTVPSVNPTKPVVGNERIKISPIFTPFGFSYYHNGLYPTRKSYVPKHAQKN